MELSFEHNNVPPETLEGITTALLDNMPFALKSPTGVLKFFNPRTLQSWHSYASVKYDSVERMGNDISMSLYRFKEFVSFDQIKQLPNAPQQLKSS